MLELMSKSKVSISNFGFDVARKNLKPEIYVGPANIELTQRP